MKNLLPILLMLVVQVVCSQNPTFPPTGELDKDTALMAFVSSLKQAITQKDVNYLLSVMDKKVVGGFDTEGGIDEFVETWGLREDSSYFWGFISRALDLSGAYVHDPHDETGRYQVVFPYLYNFEPALEDDYFALGCITGKNVNLREKPDITAAVKTQLSYDVIWYLYDDPSGPTHTGINPHGDSEWYMVQTYDRVHKGWVFWKYVYPTVGPRLFLFKNPRGQWLISAFVAGD